MKKNILLAVGFMTIVNLLSAQIGADINLYSFSKVPEITREEEASFSKSDFVTLNTSIIYDYHFSDDGTFERSVSQHNILKFYTESGIDELKNDEFADSTSLIAFQARIIHPNGSMDFLTRDSLISIKDTENQNHTTTVNIKYKINLSKLKPGDIFDYFLVLRSNMSYSGAKWFGSTNWIRDAEFTLILPAHLKMDVKVYNYDVKPIDTVLTTKDDEEENEDDALTKDAKRYTYVAFHNIPGFKDEIHAESDRNKPRVEYAIAYNLSKGKNRITSINQYVRDIDNFMNNLDKADLKAAKKIAKSIKITHEMSEMEKIQTIENYVRSKYVVFEYGNVSSISLMDKIGFGADLAFFQLFNQLFKAYDIDNRVVWTTDNQEKLFDPTFEGNNFFQEILFYFPDIDQYMAPGSNIYRVGLPPYFLTNNQGIMLDIFSTGGISSATPKVVNINPLPYNISYDSLNVVLSIEPTDKKITGSEERTFGGYLAAPLQYNMKHFEIEDEEQFLQEALGFDNENVNISGEKYFNNKPEDIAIRPLKITGRFSTADFATYNTNSIELTVGTFIGKQSKIEDKTPRVQPADLHYKHYFSRTITINIPDGYKLSEQYSKLNTAIYDTENEQNANAAFIVKTELQGNKLIIHCDEYYKQLHYDLADYPNIKRVWDASSDFNNQKITLIKQ